MKKLVDDRLRTAVVKSTTGDNRSDHGKLTLRRWIHPLRCTRNYHTSQVFNVPVDAE